MTRLNLLSPLFIAAGILLAGNGLIQSFTPLRASASGFSNFEIGLLGASYYVGFWVACIYGPRLIEKVGHIRVFAGLAALAAGATIFMYMVIDPIAWIIVRGLAGICFCGLFTVIESWLNSKSEQADRGRVLAFYRLIDLLAVAGGQFLIPAFGVANDRLFAFATLLFCLSVVPICLADRSRPEAPARTRFDLAAVWRISPAASIGVMAIGLSMSAFRSVGPLFAENVGLTETGMALFMSAGIVGGAISQYPFGLLSDRVERRVALMIGTAGAVAAGLIVSVLAGGSAGLLFVGSFLFGAFSFPLFSLSAAHANDRATADQYVLVAAGLFFFYSVGAVFGPLASALIMDVFGDRYLFVFIALVHSTLFVTSIVRVAQRPQVPFAERTKYIPLLRTSPSMASLAREKDSTTD